MIRRLPLFSLALLGAMVLVGCDDNSTFGLGLEPQICEASIPTACDTTARCSLDTDHYLSGDFPTAEKFIVRTDGVAMLNFQVLLTNERAPGGEFVLTVHESNCSAAYNYDSEGRDLFRLADVNGVLSIPVSVMRGGDHLVELVSDAYCSYALKYDSGGTMATPLLNPQSGAATPEMCACGESGNEAKPPISRGTDKVLHI